MLLSGLVLPREPFYPKWEEASTYVLLISFTLVQKYFLSKSYEYNIDFAVFVIIQSSIVFFTFLIDVQLFDKVPTAWNIVGGVVVVLSSAAAVFFY